MTQLLRAANASMEKLRAAMGRRAGDADLCAKPDVKSVSIVTTNGNQAQVDLTALARILHGYEHRPVAIISVFGDYRGGKSFLLNLLCQYLMQKQSDDWLKKKVELVKVFHWKGGVESDTSGIDITNKPFILENDKGEKIAVFLMDTQGSFDREMTVAEGSMIFAMSTLLSSVQIYNMPSGLIRENDLQNLGQFLHHANTTAGGKGHDATAAPLLPHLKFLLRNWQNEADYEVGSKGGAKYLQKFLDTNEKENKDVREKIIQGFTDVTCHLLPYPGEKLTKQRDSHDSSLKLSDLSEDFLIGVDDLGNCLFSKDNLVLKQSNGKACTGEDIMQLAVEFDRRIENGEMPVIHTLMQITQMFEFCKKIDEIVMEYEATLKLKSGEKYIDPTILEKFHTECFQKAMQQYKEHDVFEPDESEKQCQILKTRLNGCYVIIQERNNLQRVREQNKIMDEVGAAENVYMEEIEKIAGGQYLEDLTTARDRAKGKALNAFKRSTGDFNQDLVRERENKLLDAIQSKYEEFERTNAKRLKLLLQDLSNLVNECRMGYVEILEEESKKDGTVEYLWAVHQQARGSCLEKFNGSEIGNGYWCKEQQLTCLEDRISECFQEYETGVLQKERKAIEEKRQKNEKEKNYLCGVRERTVNEYLAQFKKVENKYVEYDDLHQIHESSKQQALQTYANNENNVSPEANKSFMENKDELEKEMKQIFSFKIDMNKKNKEKVQRIIQLFRAEVSVEYLETMKEVAKYGEPVLNKVHEIYKKYISAQVKQEIPISTLRQSTKEECNRMLDELREKVEAHWKTWLIYVAFGVVVLAAAGSLLAFIGIGAAGVAAAATAVVTVAEGTAVGGAITTILGGVTLVTNTSATIMLIIERFFSWMMDKSIKDSPSFTTLHEVRPFFIN